MGILENKKSIKVISVKKEPFTDKTLQELLLFNGAEISYMPNEAKAFDQIREEKADIVLADIRSNRYSSVDLFYAFENLKQKPSFIFLPDSPDPKEATDLVRKGASAYGDLASVTLEDIADVINGVVNVRENCGYTDRRRTALVLTKPYASLLPEEIPKEAHILAEAGYKVYFAGNEEQALKRIKNNVIDSIVSLDPERYGNFLKMIHAHFLFTYVIKKDSGNRDQGLFQTYSGDDLVLKTDHACKTLEDIMEWYKLLGNSSITAVLGSPGSGKSTMIELSEKEIRLVSEVINHTSRTPRPLEINGKNKVFKHRKDMLWFWAMGKYLTKPYTHWNNVDLGAIPLDDVKWKMAQGLDVLLVVGDPNKLKTIRGKYQNLKIIKITSSPEDIFNMMCGRKDWITLENMLLEKESMLATITEKCQLFDKSAVLTLDKYKPIILNNTYEDKDSYPYRDVEMASQLVSAIIPDIILEGMIEKIRKGKSIRD